MKKRFGRKIAFVLFGCTLMFAFAGCGNSDSYSQGASGSATNEDVNTDQYLLFRVDNLERIKVGFYVTDLYYDKTTNIVYWWNGFFSSDFSTAPSAYYAPNGLPYKYNPETGKLEEIDNCCNNSCCQNEDE